MSAVLYGSGGTVVQVVRDNRIETRQVSVGLLVSGQAEIREGGLLLRPAVLVPREDAWAYTPEHRALLVKARADSTADQVHDLKESDLSQG